MVSKMYFVNAARVFISNRQVVRGQLHSSSLFKMLTTPGIISAFAKQIDVTSFEAYYLPLCHSLQTVNVNFGGGDFRPLKPWKHHIDEHQFNQWLDTPSCVGLKEGILTLRGIRHLTVRVAPERRANSDVRKEIWTGNMRRFEAVIRSCIMQPKQQVGEHEGTSNKAAWTPLYEGSKVSLIISKLREGAYIPPREINQAKRSDHDDPAVTTDAYTRMMALKGKTLENEDTPRSVHELQALVSIDPQVMLEWIKSATTKLDVVRDLFK